MTAKVSRIPVPIYEKSRGYDELDNLIYWLEMSTALPENKWDETNPAASINVKINNVVTDYMTANGILDLDALPAEDGYAARRGYVASDINPVTGQPNLPPPPDAQHPIVTGPNPHGDPSLPPLPPDFPPLSAINGSNIGGALPRAASSFLTPLGAPIDTVRRYLDCAGRSGMACSSDAVAKVIRTATLVYCSKYRQEMYKGTQSAERVETMVKDALSDAIHIMQYGPEDDGRVVLPPNMTGDSGIKTSPAPKGKAEPAKSETKKVEPAAPAPEKAKKAEKPVESAEQQRLEEVQKKAEQEQQKATETVAK